MAKRNEWSNRGRFEGFRNMAPMCFALMLASFSLTAVAQTAFEFEDPMDDVRSRIEQGDSGLQRSTDPVATETPASEGATNPRAPAAAVKGPVTVFAERLGMPTAGLVGLGVLGLLALLLGLMWLIGRRKSSKSSSRKGDLYAATKGPRSRRALDSGSSKLRARKSQLDTTEDAYEDDVERVERVERPSAAAAAAKILSDVPADANVDQDEEDYTQAFETAPAKQETFFDDTDPNDPTPGVSRISTA